MSVHVLETIKFCFYFKWYLTKTSFQSCSLLLHWEHCLNGALLLSELNGLSVKVGHLANVTLYQQCSLWGPHTVSPSAPLVLLQKQPRRPFWENSSLGVSIWSQDHPARAFRTGRSDQPWGWAGAFVHLISWDEMRSSAMTAFELYCMNTVLSALKLCNTIWGV